MKILIVSIDFPPKQSIASLRPYGFAKYWSKAGHDVTVLTTQKDSQESTLHLDCSNFKKIQVPPPRWSRFIKKLLLGGKTTRDTVSPQINSSNSHIKNWLTRLRATTGIFMDQRMPSLYDGWASAATECVKSCTWDLVLTTHAPYANHLVGYALKRQGNASIWIADYRDLWTEHHLYNGLPPFTLIEKYLERQINDRADLITTVSAPLATTLCQDYDPTKIFVVENGFDTDDLASLPQKCFFSEDKVSLAYTGTIYPKIQDPTPLLRAISSIKRSECSHILENFEVSMVGACGAILSKLAQEYDVSEYFVDYGYVDRKVAMHIQRDATALLLIGSELSGHRGILTGKLFEYLFSGSTILCIGESSDGDCAKIIKETNTGVTLGNDVHLIERTIRDLLHHRKRTTNPNIEQLQRFSRQHLSTKMIELAAGKLTAV